MFPGSTISHRAAITEFHFASCSVAIFWSHFVVVVVICFFKIVSPHVYLMKYIVRKQNHYPYNMFVRAGLVAASVGASSCNQENDMSVMQLHHVKQNIAKVGGQWKRVVDAIAEASKDEVGTICVLTAEGEEAPAEGTFLVESSAVAVTVQQGFIAPSAGKYCIDKQTLALIQRANGFADTASFEQALAGKTAKSNEEVLSGKTAAPKNNTAAPRPPLLTVAKTGKGTCKDYFGPVDGLATHVTVVDPDVGLTGDAGEVQFCGTHSSPCTFIHFAGLNTSCIPPGPPAGCHRYIKTMYSTKCTALKDLSLTGNIDMKDAFSADGVLKQCADHVVTQEKQCYGPPASGPLRCNCPTSVTPTTVATTAAVR